MDNPNGTKQERDALDRLNRLALVPVIAPSDMGGVRGIDTCAAITGHHRPRKRPGPPNTWSAAEARTCRSQTSPFWVPQVRACPNRDGISATPTAAGTSMISPHSPVPAGTTSERVRLEKARTWLRPIGGATSQTGKGHLGREREAQSL